MIWKMIIKIFGFWNVYYALRNWRYALVCPFLGHKWCIGTKFKLQPDGSEFDLLTCLRCGCNKWDDKKNAKNI